MLTWLPEGLVGTRKCDAPGCQNESLPDHRLVVSPVVGPALDIPLRLFFCDEHKDVESLVQRYLAIPGMAFTGVSTGRCARAPVRAAG